LQKWAPILQSVRYFRMAKGWAVGKFGGEFGQDTQTYAGDSLFQ
jgi:hypothetical protein